MPQAGYEFHRLSVVSLPRSSPLGAARAVAIDAVARSPLRPAARAAASREAVFGGGGYVAGPVGVAAATLRVPLVIAEIDGHLGLTNRLLAPLARRVCTALPIAGHTGRKFVVTGRPIPPVPSDRDGRASALRRRAADETLVLVFGGSQGARSINEAAIDAFAGRPTSVCCTRPGSATCRTCSVPRPGLRPARLHLGLHGCGRRLRPGGRPVRRLDLGTGCGRHAVGPDSVPACDRPTIRPLNARYLADAGAAVLIPDAELTYERLRDEVHELLADHPAT